MGSLPNLHELDEIERRRERRRERELLREQRARDTSRERELLNMLAYRKKSTYNTYLMAGLGMGGGGTLGLAAATAAAAAAAAAAATATATTSTTPAAIATSSSSGGATGVSVRTMAGVGGVGGVGGGGGGGTETAAASTIASTLNSFAVGGAALLGLGTPALLAGNHHHHYQQHQQHSHPHQHQHHLHQHRHSVTSRHRVLRTRSSGAAHNIWDEQMLEHLAAYSPVSTRSHRINPVSSYQVQAALAASRRRESINSSIGANSIRRLITLNNRNCRHKVPPHVRQKVWRHFTCFTVAHGLMCAVLLPLFGLQGSNSIWHHREQWLHVGPNLGSLLLSLMSLISAAMSLLTTRLVRKFGYTLPVAANYVAVSVFLLCHLVPSIYTLLPAYILLGITLSPSFVCKMALVVHFGSRLSCSQHECTLTTSSSAHTMDALDEHKLFCNRDTKIRRLARWYHAAKDIGIIVGAVMASMVLACSSDDWSCFDFTATPSDVMHSSSSPSIPLTTIPSITATLEDSLNTTLTQNATLPSIPTIPPTLPTAAASVQETAYSQHRFWPHISGVFDDFYIHNEHGERICGADMCPVWRQSVNSLPDFTVDGYASAAAAALNETMFTHFINGKARTGGLTLIAIYFVFAVMSVLLSILIGKIQATFRHERYKGITDTVLFAGPLAYFIGTEQAYLLSDFLRAFVSCSLGINMVAGALIGMGIMQSIVSCTLSMLLRHTKRIVVIVAGFFFHSCLLLALSRWKPSSDDSALFYVLAASWGACNGMWETLLLALVTLNHTNHVTEVAAPLQGLRFLGLGVTFAAHGFVCEMPKIILLGIALVVSVPPYAMLEMRLEAQRKAQLVNL